MRAFVFHLQVSLKAVGSSLGFAVVLLLGLTGNAAPSPRPPLNVVFILADDLGWSDLGCYGADLHETPHIDRLAREGVRFTQAYAMSVCSPSRAALLTGRHPARLHMTTWREAASSPPRDYKLVPPRTVGDLPTSELTLAKRLKEAGYYTFHVGKWHLGDAEHSPETLGFDLNIGGTHWGAPATYFYPFRGPSGTSREFRYVPGLGPGKPGDYLTDRLTDEALKLIDAAGHHPFYLNLWYHCPHTPIEGKAELVEHFQKKIKPGMHHQNAGYAAMIRTLDDNVQRVLDRLKRRGLADRTVVVFGSDNGGYINVHRGQAVTDNWPLRSGKGSLYEGGVRVPLIIQIPGLTPPGTKCDEPVICMDFLPTILELCGVPPGSGESAPLDGLSLAPLLRQPQSHLARESLFFHYPHYYPTTTPVSAIRSGNWKLMEFFEDQHLELYDLSADPGEKNNLAGSQPERASQLQARLKSWRTEMHAQMPEINPSPKAGAGSGW